MERSPAMAARPAGSAAPVARALRAPSRTTAGARAGTTTRTLAAGDSDRAAWPGRARGERAESSRLVRTWAQSERAAQADPSRARVSEGAAEIFAVGEKEAPIPRGFALTESAICPRRLQKQICGMQSVEACLDVFSTYHRFLDGVHLSTLFNRIADLACRPAGRGLSGYDLAADERFRRLSSLVKARLHAMNPRSVSTVSSACAKFEHSDCDLVLSCVREVVNADLAAYGAQDLENVVWAHCKRKLPLPEWELSAWFRVIGEGAHTLSHRGQINALHACCMLQHSPEPQVTSSLLASVKSNLNAMAVAELANILCSLAHLRPPEAEVLVPEVAARVGAILSEHVGAVPSRGAGGNLLNLANVLWSFGKLKYRPSDELIGQMDSVAASRIPGAGAAALCTYLGACHRLRLKPSERTVAAALLVAHDAMLDTVGDVGIAVKLLKYLSAMGVRIEEPCLACLEHRLIHVGGQAYTKGRVLLVVDFLWSAARMRYPLGGTTAAKCLVMVEASALDVGCTVVARVVWSLGTLLPGTVAHGQGSEARDRLVERWVDLRRQFAHSQRQGRATGLLVWGLRELGEEPPREALAWLSEDLPECWAILDPHELLHALEVLPPSATSSTPGGGDWFQLAMERVLMDPFLTLEDRTMLGGITRKWNGTDGGTTVTLGGDLGKLRDVDVQEL